jgi:hypothetical protein
MVKKEDFRLIDRLKSSFFVDRKQKRLETGA